MDPKKCVCEFRLCLNLAEMRSQKEYMEKNAKWQS